jgi:predicted GH43/DUF377 family glycosyl hydrolase
MFMKWKKLGVVFCPENRFEWMKTHAANPVAENLGGSLFRVYFTSRDSQNRSSIGWLELDMKDPFKVLRLSDKPVVSPGAAGLFDDSGAAMGCLIRDQGRKFLYYLGWNLGVTVPWRNTVGLAVAESLDGSFIKHSRAPLLDRSDEDPFSISYPAILVEEGVWRMWYGSNLRWGCQPKDMDHVIKYAESKDGIHWQRRGQVAVPLQGEGEYALSKPFVLKEKGTYKMWYSHRGQSYRLGYAESVDGLNWERMDDKVGITVSGSGWDSEMMEYAWVFDAQGERYMFYNGNGYGKTGFGLAVLEKS